MKQSRIVRCLAVLLCACFCICSSCIGVSASSEEMPSTITVEWYSPEKLLSVEQQKQELILHVLVNGDEQSLKLSFPSCGGFRLHSDHEGFFKPESLADITYSDNTDGILTMNGADGTTVELDSIGQPWTLSVYNKNGGLVALFGADQMWFGYQNGELKKVKLECGISQDEVLYGLGERFGSFNQIGIKTLLWNRDQWSDKDTSYKNIPILHSSLGYMMFFNSTYSAVADIGKTDSLKYSLDFNGPIFDFYIWTGTPLQSLSAYCAITGTPLLPPKWAFRYWSGASAQTWEAEGAENSLKLLKESLQGYAKLGVTDIAALYGEGELSANSKAYNMLLGTNTRMLAWNNPFQSRLDMSYWVPELSVRPQDNELPAFKDALNPWTYISTQTMDYSNPNAQRVAQAMWAQRIKWGLRGLMIDYGESVPESGLAYNGMTGSEIHNFFSYYYSKTYYDMFKSQVGDDFILFARNAVAGSQKWAANFGGDQLGDFEGMKKAVNALLTISTCGFSSWGTDIGGYGATTSPDVYMRWMQFGAFNPLMRLHGQGPRDPWNFGKTAEETFTTYYWLRENLLNKIYSSAIIANKTGRPMAQSMAVSYPARTSLNANNDQYLFCDDFLACPVTTDSAYHRTVSLPLGNWVDLWSGETLKGGSDYDVDAPQNRSPVYIRSGTVAPVQISSDTLSLTDNMNGDKTDALLVTAPNGTRTTEYWSDADHKTLYTSSANNGTFTVSADSSQTAEVLLAYGINPAKVTVDGKTLNKLESIPNKAGETGYYVDGYHRTVIRVPTGGWSNISITPGGTLATDLALGKKITTHQQRNSTTIPENIVDGDVNTQWMITNLDEAYCTVDLGASYEINEATLKWYGSYGKKYSIQTSNDGNNWSEVQHVDNGDGMIDSLHFNPVSARYVKLCDIESSFGNNCTLYQFSVYGTGKDGKTGKVTDMSAVKDETGVAEDDNSTTTIIKRRVKKDPDSEETVSSDTTWIIAVCIAGAVIVVGGITTAVILIVKRKKKKIKITPEE